MSMSIKVYAQALEDVKKGLDKLAKKAARYSVPFSYTVGEEHPAIVHVKVPGPEMRLYETDRYTVPAVDIEVDCEGFIKREGWTVCARVEHGEHGNIVTPFGDCEPDKAWYSAAPYCEHCRTDRFRTVTFFCKDSAGRTKQVGRTCLKDYTGIDPGVAVLWAEVQDIIEKDAVRDHDRRGWEARGLEPMYEVSKVLAHAWDIIQQDGYRKAGTVGCTRDKTISALEGGEEPSARAMRAADEILEWMKVELVEQTEKEAAWNVEMRERAIQRALEDGWTMEEIQEEDSEFDPYEYWYRSEDPLRNPYTISDMERNCIPMALSGWAKMKHIGLLAYMPVDHERYMERKARKEKREQEHRAAAAASEHVGKVKDRIVVQAVSAKLVTSWESGCGYGKTYLYKFVDGNGNVFVWYASRRIQISNGMTIKGTVKDHSEYDGVKQTVLTYCAVA